MKPSTLFRTADEQPQRTLLTTGDQTIDSLLGGGLELGMCHLFYGDRILHEDFLRMAVAAQLPRAKGKLTSHHPGIDLHDIGKQMQTNIKSRVIMGDVCLLRLNQ